MQRTSTEYVCIIVTLVIHCVEFAVKVYQIQILQYCKHFLYTHPKMKNFNMTVVINIKELRKLIFLKS